jgi:2-oxoglutarate/2-oxoacid ferredoxin oxidoreductase subunit beta
MTNTQPTIKDYQSPHAPTWCPGCGDFAIWSAIKMALVSLGKSPTDVILCFDIGCNSNMADKINAYVFKGLHGRVLPVSAGISLANKNIPIVAFAGDGATFDEGMQHFIHVFRSNYNFTFILHNNCDFGLTTGQATPTTPKGLSMNSSPNGVVEERLNPDLLALSLSPTFVARGFTGQLKELADLIKKGIEHRGFSFIDTLQTCPTYNKFFDIEFYKERIYDVKTDPSYDNSDIEAARKVVDYSNEKIATGILYEVKDSVPYMDRIEYMKNEQKPLSELVEKKDITQFLAEFK